MTPSDFIAACEIGAVSFTTFVALVGAFGAMHLGRPL